MCNLYSITTNQAAIAALFRVVNRYVGNLAPMPGVFPDYPAPVIRNTDTGTEMTLMRWGMPPPRTGGRPDACVVGVIARPKTRSTMKTDGGAYQTFPAWPASRNHLQVAANLLLQSSRVFYSLLLGKPLLASKTFGIVNIHGHSK